MVDTTAFLIFTAHWPGISLLTMEQRGRLLTALMAYGADCKTPEMDQATECVFAMICLAGGN